MSKLSVEKRSIYIQMSSSINWQNLRPWGGSEHIGFEELCCQLAFYEQQLPDSKWERKGTPDAGVECLWIQPDGKKHGWQSKYFLSQPDDGQWVQVDNSVRTTLNKHSELTTYTICFPCDRQDPRIPNQKWFQDKWNERVVKWQEWASERGMSVEFRYWGESEICERLAREEHRGRYKFWFDKELFSDSWFEQRLKPTLLDAEPRYSPELNVELPIAKIFDGLGRSKDFHTRLAMLRGKIGQAWQDAEPSGKYAVYADRCRPFFDQARPLIEELRSLLQHDGPRSNEDIDWQKVKSISSSADMAIAGLRRHLDALQKDLGQEEHDRKRQANDSEKEGTVSANIGSGHHNSVGDTFGYIRNSLRKLETAISDVEDFATKSEARLYSRPFLLVHAKVGKGKTHLLCDVALSRIERQEPTVVLLGEKFTNAEPWTQILQLLGLNCTRDEFLGAMEAAAQARGGRALIFIDALNEGEGKTLWRKYLAGLLADIENFPRVGLAVSVRDSYETLVIPEGAKSRLERVGHYGFSGHEYKATHAFFGHYGIALPTIPLLHPEWSDPLFLRLFCQGLQRANRTTLPEGWVGITQTFNFFLDSINAHLARPENLDFDEQQSLVRDAALLLAKEMSQQKRQWLPRAEAQNLVNALLPRQSYEKSLFRNLLTEGVLTEERFPIYDDSTNENDEKSEPRWEIGIRFGFERFFDHLHARYLLDSHFDKNNPAITFAPNGVIGSLLSTSRSLWEYKGLLEALAIQVPERCDQELPFLLSKWVDTEQMIDAFVEALLWRTPSSITDETTRYINEHLVRSDNGEEKFLNALLTLAPRSNHPYNADFLCEHLMKLEMADRDAWWSIHLHNQYQTHGALDRLLDWAQSEADKTRINDDAIRLCATTLAWCLTTSNRFVRDRATKGMVRLLWQRLHLLPSLLTVFENVNDPYVRERILAVCYGCTMRSLDNDGIVVLARQIFDSMFKAPRENGSEVWPHILGRDYARGVVEFALHRNLILGDDAEEFKRLSRPPYGSAWPSNFLDEVETQALLEKHPSFRFSLSDMGDFGNYIVNSRLGHNNWSIRRLGEPAPPTYKERADAFIKTLVPEQIQAWEKYQSAKNSRDSWANMERSERYQTFKKKLEEAWQEYEDSGSLSLPSDEEIEKVLSDENLEAQVKTAEESFFDSLSENQRAGFEKEVRPHLNQPYTVEEPFSSKPLLGWIAQKVFQLGWTKELFGEFDKYVNYQTGSRSPDKAERVGKKYQWIAFHEIAARVADNFYMKDECDWREQRTVKHFDGPWSPHFRDIDPSILLRGTHSESETTSWWAPADYPHWYAIEKDDEWLQTDSDLPPVKPMVEVTNPADGSKWLSLNFTVHPHEPELPGEDRLSKPERGFWFMLKGYIVNSKDKPALLEWATQQDFMGRWMPESHELRDVFWGELFWAPAFQAQNGAYFGREDWMSPEEEFSFHEGLPVPILLSVDEWGQEGGNYDCSLDRSAQITIPCIRIAQEMGLQPGREGEWLNERGELIAFDPSTRAIGPSTLLIKKHEFLSYLSSANYDLVWTLLGEKQVVSASFYSKGYLKINGVLQLIVDELKCESKSEFVSSN